MKDSAALLHIRLYRENNLYGKLLGDVGKSFKKKDIFIELHMKIQTVVSQNTQSIAVIFVLLRNFAAMFLTSKKTWEESGIVE